MVVSVQPVFDALSSSRTAGSFVIVFVVFICCGMEEALVLAAAASSAASASSRPCASFWWCDCLYAKYWRHRVIAFPRRLACILGTRGITSRTCAISYSS